MYFCLIILLDLINLWESEIVLKKIYHDYESQYYLSFKYLSEYFPSCRKEKNIYSIFHSFHHNIMLLSCFLNNFVH